MYEKTLSVYLQLFCDISVEITFVPAINGKRLWRGVAPIVFSYGGSQTYLIEAN